jgi:UDP-glucose:(heptosyl)LPS alpha-1,3-glucosyltransferase
MRIAFAMINCNRRDGSARAVNEVAERLARRGHDVHLFARKAEDIDLGLITWHPVPGVQWPEVADFWTYHTRANWMLSRHDFDIVHSIGPNTSRANVVTIQNIQPAKKIILDRFAKTEQVSPARRLTRWLYLRVTSAAEHALYTRKPEPLFLPVSRGVEKELRAHYDIGSAMVRIVPNAADTAIFRPLAEEERLAWRAANGLAADDVVALFSGGEWARKGLDFAIEGVARCTVPKVKLFVAGDDADRERFLGLARSLGVGERVVFGGFRRDMAEAMGAADVFLFPSHYEAFSLATIEAAACGLPVLATRINGTEDFIQPGETGEFLEHDGAQIGRVLDRLAGDATLRRAYGAAGRKLVEEKYTWDRVAEMTENAYADFLNAQKTARS